jgi:hypothetical protein
VLKVEYKGHKVKLEHKGLKVHKEPKVQTKEHRVL